MRRGIFIAIEGLDGAGSSTQSYLLSKQFKYALLTKEPTNNNPIGHLLRSALQHYWKTDNTTLQLLFAADRQHHYQSVIEPALMSGKSVVCDRYIFSSLAYGLDNKIEWLQKINSSVPMPDITFFLNVSPVVCLSRIVNSRENTELFENVFFLTKVYKRYLILSRNISNRIAVINGAQPPERVAIAIRSGLKKQGLVPRGF